MKTTEQIIEWISNELKKLDKDEKKASNNPDIESSIESIDNIHTQRMLLNNLLKYIDESPQSVIKWEQLGDNTYIANYDEYTLKVEKIIKYVWWWWSVFPKSISGYHSIPLGEARAPLTTQKEAMQECEDFLKKIGVLK